MIDKKPKDTEDLSTRIAELEVILDYYRQQNEVYKSNAELIGAAITDNKPDNGVESSGIAEFYTCLEKLAGGTSINPEEAHLLADTGIKAIYDGLTEIPNRRALEKILDDRLDKLADLASVTQDDAVSVNRRDYLENGIGIAMFDIDNFKKYNDTYGHDVGDKVLQFVVEVVKDTLRKEEDIIARYGGEEFMIISGCNVGFVAERVRQEVEKETQKAADIYKETEGRFGIPEKVTISLGATTYYGKQTVDSLKKKADDLLYQAKEAGKNKTYVEVGMHFRADNPNSKVIRIHPEKLIPPVESKQGYTKNTPA